MSSASADKPQKQKTRKSPFGILAVKRKSKKGNKSAETAASTKVLDTELESPATEIHLTRPARAKADSGPTMATQVEELTKKLEEERQRADDLEQMLVESDSDMIKWREEEKAKTEQFEQKLRESEAEAKKWREKVANLEQIEKDLDDDSFAAAQEFQLKQQLDAVTGELDKHKAMGEELQKTKEELRDAQAQIDELQFHQQRDTTRSKMQNIREDKSSRDEAQRVQRELRQLEIKYQKETSLLQAQVKASDDTLQRAQEKALAVRRKLDDLDKEKMQLKLENKRLQRKLEKQDTYSERKKVEVEKETQELEIQNLRRQKKRLERRLSDSISNIVSPEGSRPTSSLSDITESDLSSIDGSLAGMGPNTTLSEMRIRDLEKEVNKAQAQAYKLEAENKALKEEASSVKQNEEALASQVERYQKELAESKKAYADLEAEAVQLRAQESAGGSEGYIKSLQEQLQHLEKKLEDRATEFRVKEREMRATNEELKRTVEELEMAKLRAELGEGEEGEEEEEEEGGAESEDQVEVTKLKEKLEQLTTELESVKSTNESLSEALETQKRDNEQLLKAMDEEMEDGDARNEELSLKLKELNGKYSAAMQEISRLKQTPRPQVSE